jgi:hypothetical protein
MSLSRAIVFTLVTWAVSAAGTAALVVGLGDGVLR